MHLHSLVSCVLLPLAAAAPGQSTTPSWSSRFGGNGLDEIVAVVPGPGARLTLVGTTTSTNLPSGAGPVLQATNQGNGDVFVACLDRATQSLVWCTYLGGSDLDLAFDATVDPATGVTTVVGLSRSTNFPSPAGQPAPTRNGPGDGFLARLAANGATLLTATFFGGPGHDRLCEIEPAPGGGAFVAGVTEANLPSSMYPTNPYRGGFSDAFVAHVGIAAGSGVATTSWSTHVGGGSTEGMPFASWGGLGVMWTGNLDRMAMAVDAAGGPALATASFAIGGLDAQTLNAPQPTHGGQGDCYLAVFSPGGALTYATFHGGALDERPRAIAPHPAGGFVIGGTTWSTNLPVTGGGLQPTPRGGTLGGASDGFLCRIDPALGTAGRVDSTYFGGTNGEDNVMALAVASSGVVTLAGMTAGGTFWTTPRCLQPNCAPAQWTGFVARLELASPTGLPGDELHYGTFLEHTVAPAFTETMVTGIVLDAFGDTCFVGATSSPNHPLVNPLAIAGGGVDGVFTCMPLLAGGVTRDGASVAMSPCTEPLHGSAHQAPLPGTAFTLTVAGAPANWLGVLAIGTAVPWPGVVVPPPWGSTLLVAPFTVLTASSNAFGAARHTLAIPTGLPTPTAWGLAAQWFFFTSPTCPGSGPDLLNNSDRLNF